MNPLRAVGDWLVGRTIPTHRIPFEHPDGAGFYASPIPVGGRIPQIDPASLKTIRDAPGPFDAPLSEPWRQAMGRCGADCHVRDHRDALQRLGHATLQNGILERTLRVAERDRDEALAGMADALRARDHWRARATVAEAKLRHPSTGEAA